MTYFILEPHDYHDLMRYLEVPEAVAKETREYIEAHTPYDIRAVVGEFTEEPDLTPLRRFLESDLDGMLRRFWFALWIDEPDFPLEEFRRLARKADWVGIFTLVWRAKQRKTEAEAPHKVYEVSANATLSGGGSLEETGEVRLLKDVLAQRHGELEEALADIERAYKAGRRILDQLPIRKGE